MLGSLFLCQHARGSCGLRAQDSQLAVVDVFGMDRIAVAAWTGVDPNVLALFGGEPVENLVV